ncbi:spindle and kinetochore-associated protein 1-like isoform X1 [Gadus chalcogrammus]|uniref:spindle and kinetochore-associated protein 1-like isoform X1 n=2 Tax=Gadus chalcogrammus TaxID=1042646 RepID=UPI0024C4D480|nr:spindle and kinetochore-associated protein 1-like isoform X1 [Gadus chalcogrammus]XP_056454983.1 spindle and kinetochore-associated protein 1-like isoform X1 [Gadus chalcogrammus]
MSHVLLNMSDLEDIGRHMNDRISSLWRTLDLSVVVPQLPQSNIKKLIQEVLTIEGLYHEFEKSVDRQNEQLKCLQEFVGSFQHDCESLQHLKDNVPMHMPNRENEPSPNQNIPAETQPSQQGNPCKKIQVKQMEFVTMLEFENIPQYMKGRLTYEQLNTAVRKVNEAVSGKYKITRQSTKSLNNNTRKLYQRFKDEETKDTKGRFFVVQEDLLEFSQIKMDKRFQGILSMLRHCRRLRDMRGGSITRYFIL